jgi:hypothetical protein
MDSDNIDKLKAVNAELHRREISNRPMDTEELIRSLLIMSESILELAQPVAKEAAPPPEPQTEQRHL